uniref:Putative tail collar protein n=1 Tax=viral metagenome TaxID=1070528 RepID=A0A6M3ILW6_9ZZZZ
MAMTYLTDIDTTSGADTFYVGMISTQANFVVVDGYIAEIVAGRDSEATLLARSQAITAAIAALTVGTGCPVSADDTTPGYLDGKLLAGEGVDFTVGSPAANETLTISGEDASATNKGIVELATTAECQTGTDTERAVTPAGAKASAQTFAKYTGVWGMNTSRDAGDVTNDINTTAGRCWSDDLANEIILATEITKRIDAAWGAGDDQGGLDTGSVANSTWYYLYAIYNPTTGVSDAIITATYGNPTMPSGYTKKRLIGFIWRDGAATNRAFGHIGNWWWWDVASEDWDDATFGQTATAKVMQVPLGVRVLCHFRATGYDASGAFSITFSSGDGSDQGSVNILSGPGGQLYGGSGAYDVGYHQCITDTSGQIKVDSDETSLRCAAYTIGWEYQR